MPKLRELLRLHFTCALSHRAIARVIKASASTVSCYVKAAVACSLAWEEISAMNDDELIQRLRPQCSQLKAQSLKHNIDFDTIHQELKRKGVTRLLLWQEYQQQHDRCISYSEFCRRYKAYRQTLRPTLRQVHRSGEKVFVDYAGPSVPIVNPKTGESREAMIFVGVLGASSYTYCEATWTRSLPDWIGSHVRMYEFFGGVPALTIPDNEKSGVKDASYYDPDLNPHYARMAAHYQTVALPTRPRKPQDKAKVEVGVQVVERWILARLRHHTFFSLAELNKAIATLLVDLNERPFKKLPGSRVSQFEALDKPALKALPALPYEYVDIKKAKVNLDYHLEVGQHCYSVPHHLINKTVTYHLGANIVELFYRNERVASQLRSHKVGKQTTCIDHMPHAHRQHQSWSPKLFLQWAEAIDPTVADIVKTIIAKQPHPECCYRIHNGLRNLENRYGAQRFISACQYAQQNAMLSHKSIKSILKCKIDLSPACTKEHEVSVDQAVTHTHIRGSGYYTH